MTELAYMAREDWGQEGTAMIAQSAAIRAWLGDLPYVIAVTDLKTFNQHGRDADVEAADFIAPRPLREVINISDLRQEELVANRLPVAVIVLHPYKPEDLETIRAVVEEDHVYRLFVLSWSPGDVTRKWMDGVGALNLHTRSSGTPSDPLLIAAAQMMVEEEYNGLNSGRGKDAVVQLVRAFSAEGYPLNVAIWLRAYFAAGGSFNHARSVERLLKEMTDGTRHRISPPYRDDIFAVIRAQSAVVRKIDQRPK
jgi:hypothetical protein